MTVQVQHARPRTGVIPSRLSRNEKPPVKRAHHNPAYYSARRAAHAVVVLCPRHDFVIAFYSFRSCHRWTRSKHDSFQYSKIPPPHQSGTKTTLSLFPSTRERFNNANKPQCSETTARKCVYFTNEITKTYCNTINNLA